jgi:RNA polymerase sigma-70 factor (ECF subfamily)
MIDYMLLSAVRRGSESALKQVIDRYATYICVVIRNAVKDCLTHEDIEETASDVFFALWEKAYMVENLKPWLSATARNKAKNKLREVHANLPLDAEIIMEGACKLDAPLYATLYVSDFVLLIL